MTTDLQQPAVTTNVQQPAVHITTFGYLHETAPPATLTYDLRTHFRDPHVRPELRDLTAHDAQVRDAVLATPGVADLVEAAVAAVVACLSGPGTGPVTVAAGCAGGRHRVACGLTEILGQKVRDLGREVEIEHQHAHLPRVLRAIG